MVEIKPAFTTINGEKLKDQLAKKKKKKGSHEEESAWGKTKYSEIPLGW